MANLTDKKFNAVNNLLMKYVDPEAARSFKNAHKKGKDIEWIESNWEALEGYEPWTQAYSSIDDLTMSSEEQMQKVYNRNPDFTKISKARLKAILDNGDFTEQKLRNYYKFREEQKKRVDKINQDRYAEKSNEYNKVTRSKEDSYYNSPLANEYARKAYIEGNKDAALYNEIAGKAAAAADFIPGPAGLIGPVIRTGQKWAANEPVLTGGTAADFAGALIPEFAEKPAKMAFQYLKGNKYLNKLLESKVGKQIEARIKKADAREADVATKELDNFKNVDLDAMTNDELLKYYNSVHTPELKAEISNYWKTRGDLEEAKSFEEISDIANGPDLRLTSAIAERERNAAEQALIESERKAKYIADRKIPELELKSGQMKPDQPLFTNGDFNAYYKDVPIEAIAERMAVEPNKKADLLYNVLTLGGRKMARSTLGGRAGQWDMFDPEPKDTRDQDVEWVIKTFGKEWSPTAKPTNYDNDPLIKEAYDKWLQDVQVNSYPVWLKTRGK